MGIENEGPDFRSSEDGQVCAVVVTHNRQALLHQCLEALLAQRRPPNAICIVDNRSTDGTGRSLYTAGYLAAAPPEEPAAPICLGPNYVATEGGAGVRVHYVGMHENGGGAGGFHEGVKRAYEAGYRWLWLMDDDGRPERDCLRRLMEVAEQGFDYVASNLVDETGASHFERRFLIARTPVINFRGGPYNAVLLSRRLISAVGYPMKRLFIWGDEMEYTDRMVEAGFPLVTVQDAKHYHKRTTVDFRRCTRGYYLARNSIYRARLFQGAFSSRFVFSCGRLYACWRYLAGCLLRLRLVELAASVRGILHGCVDSLREEKRECCWWGLREP